MNRDVVEDSITSGVSKGVFGLGELRDGEPHCSFFHNEASVSFAENEIIVQDLLCAKPDSEDPTAEELPTPYKPKGSEDEGGRPRVSETDRTSLSIEFEIPEGRVNDAWGIMRLLNEKFRSIQIGIAAKNGAITESDVAQIRETLKQMGINLDL